MVEVGRGQKTRLNLRKCFENFVIGRFLACNVFFFSVEERTGEGEKKLALKNMEKGAEKRGDAI